jgi:hypothetical protein
MEQDRIYTYFERNPQLHVLFIFDQMNDIGSVLEGAVWKDGYIYVVFDGAWFNTKYAIENDWKDKHIVLLLNKDLYPYNEEKQLKFPLLDMLKANMEYKNEDYASFMQQYNLPQKYASFIKKHIGEIMSTKISNILNGHFSSETFSEDVMCRGFISSYLGEKKLLDWEDIIVRMIILGLDSEQKKRLDFFSRLERNLDAKNMVNSKLTTLYGVSYNPNSEVKIKEVAECMKYNAITQLLDLVPSDNYKSYKITNAIVLDQINKIYETGLHDRLRSDKFVEALKTLASNIKEDVIIQCYGIDAQYFYITETLCWTILKQIIEKQLMADPSAVNERMRELSLKLSESSDIQIAIRFVEQMALYYDKIRTIDTLKLNTPEEYVGRYTSDLYLVDLFYRRSLEAYHQLVTKEIPIEQTLNNAKNGLDIEYAKISNIMNLEWLTCVNEREDLFDSIALPKQENFFDEELDASTKKVVVVCDALRYEVAAELMQELSKEKHIAKLSAMRTMLPTETKFCKLALLPHKLLELQGADMTIDGQLLTTIEQRTAYVNKYREGAVCVNYEDVMNGVIPNLREFFKKPLVYIFYNTIDEASHSQSPFEVIKACRSAIEQLTVLIRRLHASWNVTNVIVTSDHGFIYHDMQFEEKDKHSIIEDFIEKKTRYYLTNNSQGVEGISKYPLEKVSAMKTTTKTYVAVPTGTNRMAAPGGYNFAHGGATLQEMIIPIIHSYRKKTDKTEKVGVSLMNRNLNMVSSQLKFQLIQSEAVTMTVTERTISCCIYNGEEAATAIKTIVLNSPDSENLNNRVYEVTLNLNKSVKGTMLQLRIWDVDDELNPLIKETVKNNTIIEQDF